MKSISVAVAKGDGIGPEIMDAVISIFNAASVPLDYKYVDIGRSVFMSGHKMGMTEDAKKTVESLGVLFKGPMETPKGGGNRSINVTARKMWSTFANCRVFRTIPGVETVYSKAGVPINLTIIRENLEDTYGGVEHRLAPDLAVSRRFTTATGAYQLHKYAFEYAKANKISKVACAHKSNIMKITDGMYLKVFYEVAKEYPEIQASDVIVDDLCMKLVTIPDSFELVILPNLQGDIVSDLCAGLVGGLGFAPSANIGNNVRIFEAVHGTAPDIIGKGVANPTALLMSGLMMLRELGFHASASNIENAMMSVLREGVHTPDLKGGKAVSTKEYIDSIIAKLDNTKEEVPSQATNSGKDGMNSFNHFLSNKYAKESSTNVGVDITIESDDSIDNIAEFVNSNCSKDAKLEIIHNRGTQVYPVKSQFTDCVHSYTLRFISQDKDFSVESVTSLMSAVSSKYSLLSVEFLRSYPDSDVSGYSII